MVAIQQICRLHVGSTMQCTHLGAVCQRECRRRCVSLCVCAVAHQPARRGRPRRARGPTVYDRLRGTSILCKRVNECSRCFGQHTRVGRYIIIIFVPSRKIPGIYIIVLLSLLSTVRTATCEVRGAERAETSLRSRPRAGARRTTDPTGRECRACLSLVRCTARGGRDADTHVGSDCPPRGTRYGATTS